MHVSLGLLLSSGTGVLVGLLIRHTQWGIEAAAGIVAIVGVFAVMPLFATK